MILIKLVILLNALASGWFLICNWKNGQKKYLAFFFLLLPVMGFYTYYISSYLWDKNMIPGYDRDYLVRRYAGIRDQQDIDIEKALSIAPLEDVLSIGDRHQRREMLLDGLKKGVNENYKKFLQASNNEDTETAHYISSAKMTVFRDLYGRFGTNIEEFKEDPSPENEKKLLLSINALIRSELLSEEEIMMYHLLFCDTISGSHDHGHEITEMHLDSLRALGRYEEAQKIFLEIPVTERTELMYKSMLNIYYSQKQFELFQQCMNELKHSQLTLTSAGLGMIRFWERRENV